jgi:thiol-disulfide isomerase/thioredoxin
MRNLDAQYVADLVVSAHEKTNKKIVLMARAYGAIPMLRGATIWQLQHPEENYLSGGILFSPDFFTSIPELGLDPDYLPVTSQSTIPLMIYQSGRRGTAWQFPRLLKTLSKTNENVYFKLMPNVSGIFYGNDVDPASHTMLHSLPKEIPGVIHLLQNSNAKQPPPYKQGTSIHTARLNTELKIFKGPNVPQPFTLRDINDKTITLDDLQGKVTLVNFWATWCPPCLEEIPSLNRLTQKMQGKPFRLISINYAESKTLVSDFLKRVNVEFPVLLDHNGKISAQWNVIAFPSTFVIGPDGKIHYGINAAIAWDDPRVIDKLNSLLTRGND